MFISSLSIEF